MAAMTGGGQGQPTGSTSTPYTPFTHPPQQDPGEARPGGGGGGGGGVYSGGGGGTPTSPSSAGSPTDKLRLAASKGQVDKVQEMLQAGAGMEPDRDGRTGLHYAAQNGYPDVCKLLIEKGCELDVQDTMGYTALLRACSQGLLGVVRVCLEAGCAVDFADEHGNTALHEAAWHGFSKTVELLIKYNANVFRVNNSGFTALHLAAQNGHNESSRVLLYGGINPDLQNNYGDTALHTAARYGHAGVTRILISAKCKLNLPNKNGDTALHIAAALKRRKIAKILVESHVDIHVRNKQNETAIDVARRKEHPEIILIITSLSRPHSAGPKTREIPGVTFKDDIEVEDGPVVCADDEPPIKSEKPEKERRSFPFFWKKKKDKEKEKTTPATTTQVKRPIPASKVQPVPSKPVSGFFSQYVPRAGTQYYRDLAGNIKQGPVGYTPVCQCGPALHHIEKAMHNTKEQLYDHIDASHQVLQDRIEQLDLRASQQAHSLDKLTLERLEEERRACRVAIEERLQRERHHTQYVVESYGEDLQDHIQGWLEDRLASYGHCLDHHHDDSALPPRHIFTDVHLGPNGGRLFRSRSDETLSVSDYSGKGRKRQFYASRKAAMEQIRGWKVPTKDSSSKRRERGRSADNLENRDSRSRDHNKNTSNNKNPGMAASMGDVVTIAEVHKSRDRLPDGASPKHEGETVGGRQQSVEKHVGFGVDPSYGAIPKRSSQFYSPNRQSHSQMPVQSHQTRSQGNLSSQVQYHPPGAPACSTSPHYPPPPSQNPASAQQPRRGILRSKTDDSALHERARSSTRQQQNLDGRGPLDESLSGPNPGGCGGPSVIKPSASTGRGGNVAAPQHNPLYGTAHSVLDAMQSSQNQADVVESQRYRPRTGSVDTILDGAYGGGGKFRSKSEERVLDSVEGAPVPPSTAGDFSGYVTDSGVRRSYFDHPTPNYRPVSHDRNPGYWSNTNVQSESDSRTSGGRVVSSDRSGAGRSASADRPVNSMITNNTPRPIPRDRNSGYFTDSEVKRSTQGNSQFTNSSPFANHLMPNRQQGQQPKYQPTTRYRVLPPLPPTFGERTKPPIAPKPTNHNSTRNVNQSVYDRTASHTPTVNANTGSGFSAQTPDRFAHRPSEGSTGGVYQNYNYGALPPRANGVQGQDRTPARHTDSPREHNLAAKDRSAHHSTTALHSAAHQLNSSTTRTPSPYQTQAMSGKSSVSKSESNLTRDSNHSSPREPVSSGHYSVTNGCLRHDSYSYSPVYNNGGSKEDSTCSSNQDSGYSSRMVLDPQGKVHGGGGRSGESTTPSSSFSTDRSISLGPSSNTSSPYMHMGGNNSYSDYVQMRNYPNSSFKSNQQNHVNLPSYADYQKAAPRNNLDYQQVNKPSQQARSGTTSSSQTGGNVGANLQKQVQGWYQQRLLEAAERLRNSERYQPAADNKYSNYTSIPIHYDPVHGSDV